MNVLEISELKKSFGGRPVLRGLDLAVPEHSVFGLIGQNGAGKTTTMKIVLGLIKADAGNLSVCQTPVRFGDARTNRMIGYLPDVPEFYGYMTPTEYLTLCGKVAGVSAKECGKRCEELLEMTGLSAFRKKRIAGFSRGMKQRLGIAQALFGRPRLLICDEPTSALDPMGRKEILDLLSRARENTTVIFSTHVLADVERICDQIAILKDGRIALGGDLERLREAGGSDTLRVELESETDARHLLSLCQEKKLGICALEGRNTLTLRTAEIRKTEAELFTLFGEHGLMPVKLEREEPTLENLFLEVVQ